MLCFVTKILLGDAIVCWRASLLWPGNLAIRAGAIILLLTTFGEFPVTCRPVLALIPLLPGRSALGVIDTRGTCLDLYDSWDGSTVGSGLIIYGAQGGLYQGTPYGLAASVLSLSTNFFATSIVAYKAWSVISQGCV